MSNETTETTAATKTLEKRGRKKGSTDSVFITPETLLKYIGMQTAIPVRRKWLAQIESLHNVKFVDENTIAKVEPCTVVPVEEETSDEKASVIRPRLEIAEEQL